MKLCKKCSQEKSLFDFSAHRGTKDKLQTYCKSCAKESTRNFFAKNPGYQRKRAYGMDNAEFERLLASQNGGCAICETPIDKPHVDHDHKSGRVRALLCKHCNLGLGHFFDDPKMLNRASQYLVFHGH